MRIVLDTNVLVSALLSPHGPPARILDGVLLGETMLLVDDRILDEYRRVLERPKFGFDARDVTILLGMLEKQAEPVTAMPLSIQLPDPDDLPFLEVAHAGVADAIVTGNIRDFRPRRRRSSVVIMTPRELMAALRR